MKTINKLIFIATTYIISAPCFAGCFHTSSASADSWAGWDKKAHIGVSAALGVGSSIIFKDSEHPIIYPLASTFSIGLAKELYDSRCGGTGFSYRDLSADALGAILGVGIGNTYFYFANHSANIGYSNSF